MFLFLKQHKFKILIALSVLSVTTIVVCNNWVVSSTKTQLYSDITKIPTRKVGLVLGTSKLSRRGTPNLYFTYRILASYQLFVAKKINYLLLSGDNHTAGYDEPTDMRNALLALGVPDSCIVLDYAGFRTLDSVERCRKIFGEDSITIISQEFHNQRALFIANKTHINAIGFNAKQVNKQYSIRTTVREYFARVKCVLDLYVFHTSPKFLGKTISIGAAKK